MIKYKVLLFALIPSLIASYIIWQKVAYYGVNYKPESNATTWKIEAHVKGQGTGRTARIEVELPVVLEKHQIISENFISNGFAVAMLNNQDSRKAVWTGKTKTSTDYDFYYRATINVAPEVAIKRTAVLAGQDGIETDPKLIKAILKQLKLSSGELVENIDKFCAELVKGSSKAAEELRNVYGDKLINMVSDSLNIAGIPARVVRAIKIEGSQRGIKFHRVIEVNVLGVWRSIDYRNGNKLSDRWMVWRRSRDALLVSNNLIDGNITVSVTPEIAPLTRPNLPTAVLKKFPSVQALPVDAQALYSIIMVIPVGALVVAFIRSIIGIKTLGTFMPVLVALAFRETELFWGLTLFVTIIVLSLIVRYFFEHLQLLVVPRLTATLTLVVIVIFLFSLLMENIAVNRALSVALFPIVILTMMIERISIIWEELGLWKASWQTAISLAVASLIYLVISNHYVQYYMVVFPELLLIILSISILLGRFTGYRLTELYRFRSFIQAKPK